MCIKNWDADYDSLLQPCNVSSLASRSNCASYTKLSTIIIFIPMRLLRDRTCLEMWETAVPMHFRGLWYTLMPTNFHFFSAHDCTVEYFLHNRSCVCPLHNCSATIWQECSLWGHCRGWLQKLWPNGDKLITIATLHQSSNSVCLKGSKVNIKYRLHLCKKIMSASMVRFRMNALYDKSTTVYGRHKITVTVILWTEGCVQVKGILSISTI